MYLFHYPDETVLNRLVRTKNENERERTCEFLIKNE